MIVFKRWYNELLKYVGRFRTGQKAQVVRAYISEETRRKPTGPLADRRSPSEEPGRLALDINKLDQQLENDSVKGRIPISSVGRTVKARTCQDIDSTGFDNLEDYAEGLSVSGETIAKWVSAGILSPRETAEAEKLIKIMREKSMLERLTDPSSSSDS